jgi:hypothetical protein
MLLQVFALLAALAAPMDQPTPDRYAVGQVWEYHVRKGDEGSLLKIQQIEQDPAQAKLGPIYHVSVIGVHFRNAQVPGVLQHIPVSRKTLDASVTRRIETSAAFPDPSNGIAEWRNDHGGVFAIPVSEIVEIVDEQTAKFPK